MNSGDKDYRTILEELSNSGVLTSFDVGLAVWSKPGKNWFCKYTIKYKEFSVSSEWLYAETIDEAIAEGAKNALVRLENIKNLP